LTEIFTEIVNELKLSFERGSDFWSLSAEKDDRRIFSFSFSKLDELSDAAKRLIVSQIIANGGLSEEAKSKLFLALTRLTIKAKEGKNEVKPLRESCEFALLNKLYVKPTVPASPDPSLIRKEWVLWEGKTDLDLPPIFILDEENRISPAKKSLALEPLGEEKIQEVLRLSPSFVDSKVKRVLQQYNSEAKCEEGKLAPDVKNIFFKAVPRIRDPSFLRDIDFPKLVDEITSFKAVKDPALQAIHKSHLLKGVVMSVNPHSIQATNSGTGKSLFYFMLGVNVGRATPSSFLGFAKSPDEIYPGPIHNNDLPTNIDQIESQYAVQIVRFLFNILEFGRDVVRSGAVDFEVRTNSIFNFSANPIGYSKNPAKSFANLLSHFTLNPAIGRRIALILYGTDFKVITKKPSQDDLREWKEKIELFRATEEYCSTTINQIIHNPKVWSWLNRGIEVYEESVREQAEGLEDYSVVDLLLEHAVGAQVRIRAAALYSTLAETLGRIALGDYSVDEIIEEAEEKLPTYVLINIKSIQRIAQAWAKEKEILATTYFNSAPSYIQEILSAIELWRRSKPEANETVLSSIPYTPASYDQFSKCVDKLRNRRRKEDLIKKFQELYGIDLTPFDKDFKIVLLRTEPCPYIHPKGKLSSPISQVSPFPQPSETPTLDKDGNGGVSGKSGNGENREIGEAPFECGVCRAKFFSIDDLKAHFDSLHARGKER
jgi:hypothetical protein